MRTKYLSAFFIIFFMDTEILARVQFAFTIAFHYIYPPMSIGLGLILVIMEGLFLKTGNIIYEQMTRFLYSTFVFWTFKGKVKLDEMSY